MQMSNHMVSAGGQEYKQELRIPAEPGVWLTSYT